MSWYELFRALEHSDRIPRKKKLAILGRKPSKKKIKETIKQYTLEEFGTICPKCTGMASYFISHPVEYPEIWREQFCLRDHTLMAYADNCEWTRVLDQILIEDHDVYKTNKAKYRR